MDYWLVSGEFSFGVRRSPARSYSFFNSWNTAPGSRRGMGASRSPSPPPKGGVAQDFGPNGTCAVPTALSGSSRLTSSAFGRLPSSRFVISRETTSCGTDSIATNQDHEVGTVIFFIESSLYLARNVVSKVTPSTSTRLISHQRLWRMACSSSYGFIGAETSARFL